MKYHVNIPCYKGVGAVMSYIDETIGIRPVNQRRLYNDYSTCLEHVGYWNTLGSRCTNVAGSPGGHPTYISLQAPLLSTSGKIREILYREISL